MDLEYDDGRVSTKRWLNHRGARGTGYNQTDRIAETSELQLKLLLTVSKQLEELQETLQELSAKIKARD
jgi:hypothetical protein